MKSRDEIIAELPACPECGSDQVHVTRHDMLVCADCPHCYGFYDDSAGKLNTEACDDYDDDPEEDE